MFGRDHDLARHVAPLIGAPSSPYETHDARGGVRAAATAFDGLHEKRALPPSCLGVPLSCLAWGINAIHTTRHLADNLRALVMQEPRASHIHVSLAFTKQIDAFGWRILRHSRGSARLHACKPFERRVHRIHVFSKSVIHALSAFRLGVSG
jgi:hypothetical protein